MKGALVRERKDADLWILIWEELHRFHQEGTLDEVEHVRGHRTKKEMQVMSLFEKFIIEGNEKADEPGREESCLHGGDMAQVSAITIQQERGRRFMQPCNVQLASTVWWKDCEEHEPWPEVKWTFVNQEEEAEVCDSKQVSVYEMWEEKAKHEDTREM